MKCQLCHEEKPLLKRSHIVPNFMYKSILKDNRKMVSININNLTGKPRYMQTGYTEEGLLCADCDNRILGSLERYASNNIYSKPSASSGVTRKEYAGDHEIVPYIRYEHLDYTKTKLFFLSILWRCHISKNKAFSDVSLGPYAEHIRKMILKNNPGRDDEYEVILIFLDTEGTRPSKSVIDPRKITKGGNTFYVFHINEIMYHFNISQHNRMDIFTKGAIRSDNTMDIAVLKGKWARGHFDKYLGRKLLMKGYIQY